MKTNLIKNQIVVVFNSPSNLIRQVEVYNSQSVKIN